MNFLGFQGFMEQLAQLLNKIAKGREDPKMEMQYKGSFAVKKNKITINLFIQQNIHKK